MWFTERFDHAVGNLDPSNNQVTECQLAAGAGPGYIAAAPNGAVWFTQFSAGNIARITPDGTISEGRSVNGSGPFGITIGPNGNPWYAMHDANKIAPWQSR